MSENDSMQTKRHFLEMISGLEVPRDNRSEKDKIDYKCLFYVPETTIYLRIHNKFEGGRQTD